MIIGGLQKFSLLDYPGKISAIVFTQGCNFRCQFCYNPMLVWPVKGSKLKYVRELIRESGREIEQQKAHPIINQDDFFVFLKDRSGKLDAVVITGGEPCLQKDLVEFIKKIKALGYLIKLDTNGSYPEVLAELVKEKLIDYIAMDLKAPEYKYGEVTEVSVDFNYIHPVKSSRQAERILPVAKLFDGVKKSVKIIRASGLPYEFRTTVVPDLLDKNDINEMGKIIKGAGKWYLQNFKSQSELVNQKLKGKVPYNSRQMNEMAEIGRKYAKICEVR
ncbi:MAG: anaerobic ribonucleoside-triphosphate reductase activating protein [bacterium]|nr:anaerobic ribonucleoside-triphosphate reductase activating protein [bacterium]